MERILPINWLNIQYIVQYIVFNIVLFQYSIYDCDCFFHLSDLVEWIDWTFNRLWSHWIDYWNDCLFERKDYLLILAIDWMNKWFYLYD